MRANSLYHLLMIRARKLIESQPDIEKNLAPARDSLAVENRRGGFTLTWQARGQSFSLDVPKGRFAFYLRSDHPVALNKRATSTNNLRARNWEAATETWQEVLNLSGYNVALNAGDPALGLVGSLTRNIMGAADISVRLIVIALTTGVGWLRNDIDGAALGFATAALVVLIVDRIDSSHFCRKASLLEITLSAGGPCLAAAIKSLSPYGLVAAAFLLFLLEAERREHPRYWGLAGAAGGASLYFAGVFGILPVAIAAASVLSVAKIAPIRTNSSYMWIFLGAAGIAGTIALVTGPPPFATVEIPVALAWAAMIVGIAAASLWWFFGTLYFVHTWTVLIIIAAMSIGSRFVTAPDIAGAALSLTGISLACLWRQSANSIRQVSPSIQN